MKFKNKFNILRFVIIMSCIFNGIFIIPEWVHNDLNNNIPVIFLLNIFLLIYFIYKYSIFIKEIEINKDTLYIYKYYKAYSCKIKDLKIGERFTYGKFIPNRLLKIKMENHFRKFKIYSYEWDANYEKIKELLGYKK